MKIEKLYYRLAFLLIALAVVLVGYGALYFPFTHSSLTDAQIFSVNGKMFAVAIILLATAWALMEIAEQGPGTKDED